MSTRRAVVVVMIFLLITGFASSLDPRPLSGPKAPSTTTATAPPLEQTSRQRTEEVRLRAGDPPATRRVALGSHVIATVEVDEPGDVELAALGLLESATPRAPAVFDLLARRAGRYPVMFTSTTGEQRELGALVISG